MDDEAKAAGERLRAEIAAARGRRTVTDLATKSGVLRQTLYKWFGGGTPNLIELRKVARQLEIPVASLVAAWDGPSASSDAGATNDLSPATRAVQDTQGADIAGLRESVDALAKLLRAGASEGRVER